MWTGGTGPSYSQEEGTECPEHVWTEPATAAALTQERRAGVGQGSSWTWGQSQTCIQGLDSHFLRVLDFIFDSSDRFGSREGKNLICGWRTGRVLLEAVPGSGDPGPVIPSEEGLVSR